MTPGCDCPSRTGDLRRLIAYQALRIAIDLVGTIGRHVLDGLLLDRRRRTTLRVVGRAISDYAPHTASG